jgi:hypothetical protein
LFLLLLFSSPSFPSLSSLSPAIKQYLLLPFSLLLQNNERIAGCSPRRPHHHHHLQNIVPNFKTCRRKRRRRSPITQTALLLSSTSTTLFVHHHHLQNAKSQQDQNRHLYKD